MTSSGATASSCSSPPPPPRPPCGASATSHTARIREAIDVDRRTRDAAAERAAVADRIAQLTPREHEVMELRAVGKSPKTIAAVLSISVRTVESHRRTELRKLGVSSAAQLARAVARVQLP